MVIRCELGAALMLRRHAHPFQRAGDRRSERLKFSRRARPASRRGTRRPGGADLRSRMPSSATFVRHFARLVALLGTTPGAVDEQKSALRAAVLVARDGAVTLTRTNDGEWAVNGTPLAGALPDVGTLRARLDAHGVGGLSIEAAAPPGDLLALARTLAGPRAGDADDDGLAVLAGLDGGRVRVSECDDLLAARVVTSGLEYWRDTATGAGRAAFDQLVLATRFTRTWGDGFGYYLVATGRAELFCDPICGQYYDYAPFVVIMPEAGARLSRFDGSPLAPMSSALASNALLHDRAAAILLGG